MRQHRPLGLQAEAAHFLHGEAYQIATDCKGTFAKVSGMVKIGQEPPFPPTERPTALEQGPECCQYNPLPIRFPYFTAEMSSISFKQVDVFTTVRFKGNPVAVVLQAGELSTDQMQQLANWTNLSETTFVVPITDAQADYHVRIFTPNSALPFAGHPTIGTAHALLEAGLVTAKDGVLVQQCGAGLVRLKVDHAEDGAQWIFFELPEPKMRALTASQVQELEGILGTPLTRSPAPYLIDVGARWVVAQLPSAEAVLKAEPDLQRMKVQDFKGQHTGVVIFGEQDKGAQSRIEVRAFAPAHGVNEDPVCGSGNGSVGAYIRQTGQSEHFGDDFLATQGAVVGRAGVLRLTLDGNKMQVGGNAITCIDGVLTL